MSNPEVSTQRSDWPKLALLPVPAKALVTMIILTMAFAMLGASGQIIVHDIIPTFFAEEGVVAKSAGEVESPPQPQTREDTFGRGDLFDMETVEKKVVKPFYKQEQFVWSLKWTHIHLFGMSMIFIFVGAVTLFLDLSIKARTWLIVLPFVGVLVDISGVWLKGYISPAFFWLHIPGGTLFVAIFIFVALRALWEMWYQNSSG
jgi:hypothetical protein